MIGYDLGTTGGGRTPDPPSVRETWEQGAQYLRERVEDVLEPVWDVVTRVEEAARWVLERVVVIYAMPVERWVTGADERVCPECGPLAGMTWLAGEGPLPPLHVNCRCRREAAGVEWRSREVNEWRLQWGTREVWGWEVTGWA
jgi:hypothetical protein